MLNTLHRKLTAASVAIFIAFAVVATSLNLRATRGFLDEVNQGVALTLAAKISAQRPLFVANQRDERAVQAFFSDAMVINPLAEMYLLDPRGHIVASSIPSSDIRRPTVDLTPVRALLAGQKPPVRGDDPRDDRRRKVFSVAELPAKQGSETAAPIQGYLYIVLGGVEFDSTLRMLLGSQILRWGAWSIGISLAAALLFSLVMFRGLTAPLRRLTDHVTRFHSAGYRADTIALSAPSRWPDEVQQLSASFAAMAAELAVYIERLKRADAQRRELVANVSHDLKSPIAAVQGYLDTLLIKGAALSDDQRRAFLELALSQGRRVDRLVSELLELSRLEGGEPELNLEPMVICDLVQDVVQKCQHSAAERHVRLTASIEPDVPLVHIDVRLIERLLDNLVDNALRHAGEGGTVVVSCGVDAGAVMLRVEDSGEGIHPDDLPHIFERFYRGRLASGSPGGSGLGLAISRRIAEVHGGRLTARSAQSRGSLFELALPLPERVTA